jgi:hypothetical protein
MKKQRAVDYFYSQLTVIPFMEKMKMKGIFIPLEKYHDILEKAEAMEKEQIRDSYIKGYQYRDTFGWEGEVYWEDDYHFPENEQALKDYYNETYGGDK